MLFKLIVATTHDNGIGYKNSLPWKIREELKEFAKTTIKNKKNIVVMGKNTWNSIPNKPLKNRINVIISSTLSQENLDINNNSIHIYDSISDFLNNNIKYKEIEECWIIGGERIYKSFLTEHQDLLDEIHITRIKHDYLCDTYFTEIPESATLIQSETAVYHDNSINRNVEVTKEVYSLK